jgi:hypothetical protein
MSRTIAVLIATLALAVPAMASAQADSSSSLAQERYYSSYGDAASAPAPAPAVPADDAPWKALAIGSGALVLALLGAEIVTLARLRRAT